MDISTIEASTNTDFPKIGYIDFAPKVADAECLSRKWPFESAFKHCMKLTGFAGESQEKASTEFCTGHKAMLTTWQTDIEQMFLNFHDIKGNMIAQKVVEAVERIEDERGLGFGYHNEELASDAMAPLLCT